MREPTVRISQTRIWQVKLLHDLLNSYSAVGRLLGVSRERVRQVLAKGQRRGWLQARPVKVRKLRLPPVDFLRAFLETGDEESLRKRLGWSRRDLEKYVNRIGIDLATLRIEHESTEGEEQDSAGE